MSSSQRLVFSFLEFLTTECESRSEDERESLEVVIECLERVYNMSLSNSNDVSKFHCEKSLTEIFDSATQKTSTGSKEFPTDEDKAKAEELKTQGNDLMKSGKYEDAIDCYNGAINLDWTNAVYLSNRAAAYSKLGQHEEAVNSCKESLELDPKYGKAYGRMGTAYMALGKYQEAKDSFVKAKELDPSNELYTNNLRAAEEKLANEGSPLGSQGLGGNPATLMSSLFSNPGVMNMAQQFMTNPQMQQMMSNMMGGMGGLGGMAGGGQPPAGAQPDTNQPPEGPPDPAGRSESNPENEEANPGTGGYSNIFQFATQMAQQLEQTNPELVNSLRQGMQSMRGGSQGQSENAEDPSQNGSK